MILFCAAALVAQDRVRLIEQRIMYTLLMLGQRLAWQIVEREVAAFIDIVVIDDAERAASDLTAKSEDDLLFQWF